jgi:50S ribosomal subunit-associated GTPase HflX
MAGRVAMAISARRGEGVDELLGRIDDLLSERRRRTSAIYPSNWPIKV